MTGSDSTWLDVLVKVETEKAVLLSNGSREAWVPKSQILDSEDDIGVGVETKVELPVWLAEVKELV